MSSLLGLLHSEVRTRIREADPTANVSSLPFVTPSTTDQNPVGGFDTHGEHDIALSQSQSNDRQDFEYSNVNMDFASLPPYEGEGDMSAEDWQTWSWAFDLPSL
jgi:hypothetical protein